MVSRIVVVLVAFAALGLVKAETVDWGFNTYAPRTVNVGEDLVFTWTGFHNVHQVAAAACNSTLIKEIAPPSSGGSVTVPLTKPGTYHFICSVGSHCAGGGMLLTVNVAEPPIAKAWAIGSKQIPPTDSKAVAWTTITTLNATHYNLRFRLTKPIKNMVLAHIHAGNKTTSGPVIATIYPAKGVAPKPISGTPFITFAFDASYLEGDYANNQTKFQGGLDYRQLYVNVHTTKYPGGEIRGQLHYNP